MSKYNSTYDYHKNLRIDLLTEYTVCESFSSIKSPYMAALKNPKAYGSLIGDFLAGKALLKSGSIIMEGGGGYGSLMRGVMESYSDLVQHVYMIDLSLYLLNKQRNNLLPWRDKIFFIQGDINYILESIKTKVDVLILNEMIGDLDMLVDISSENMQSAESLIKEYELDIPGEGPFNFNVGAIKLVEAICKKNIPVFITEHSSDPIMPEGMDFLSEGIECNSYPREIQLYGHSEYTIRFSHLIKVARMLGRDTLTGPLANIVGIKKSSDMKFIFTNRACSTEKQEIIYEILDHIREYRWLLIM